MSERPLAGGLGPRPEGLPGQGGAGTQSLGVLVAVIAALYFGREIFVPIALAALLSFALAPLVSALRRRHVPKAPAVVTVVLLAFLSIFAFGLVVAGQVSQLGQNLPQYQYNIQEKIRSLRSGATGTGLVERASEMLRELSDEIEEAAETPAAEQAAPSPAQGADEREPIPVQIQQPDPAPLELLQTVLGPLIQPLTTSGIVVVFVIFMLLQREDLRDRFIRLAGSGDLHRTTQALGDAGHRIGKYLMMQLVVNLTYGVPVGVGLWLIGVPNPLLWGMLATILRFVPYIGPVIAAIFPLALSIAVDPGWTMLLWAASLFIVLELISNNFVEPWLYGSSTGLSPVAIIVAAIFWTWLWGPVGLLLSTPLTVCLVVLGRHAPQFGFLNVLLGSEPVLTPEESLYQRLLAGDPDEATERAEEFIKERSLLAFYDEVAIPALALAEHDRVRCVLDDDRRALFAASALAVVDNLSDHEEVAPSAEEDGKGDAGRRRAAPRPSPAVPAGPDSTGGTVLCAGGRGNLDDAASAILAQLLERRGVAVRPVLFDALASASLAGLDMRDVRMVCLSYMNPESLAHARYLVRRLRRRTDVPIFVGFWSVEAEDAERLDLAATTRADLAATRLEAAVDGILRVVGGPAEADAGGAAPAELPPARSSVGS